MVYISEKPRIKVNNLVTVHDVTSITEFGNNLADLIELMNDGFGNLLCLEIFINIFLGFLDIYIAFSSAVNIVASYKKPSKILFVMLFGIYFLFLGILHLRRMKILTIKGSKLKQELMKSWISLREVSILKYPQMQKDQQQVYEISALSQKFYSLFAQGTLIPNDYFHLEASLMTKTIPWMISLILVLISLHSNNISYSNYFMNNNITLAE